MTQASKQGDFLAQFYNSHQISEETIEYFRSQPWLRRSLLPKPKRRVGNRDPATSSTATTTSIIATPFTGETLTQPLQFRYLKDTGEDFFFARTLATPTTIPHMLCLNHRTVATLPETPAGTIMPANDWRSPTQVPEKPDCIFLINLAGPAIDGHPHICHGGVIASILDEAIGLVTMLHTQSADSLREPFYTVNLNVTYRAPVTTPSDVIVRCWLKARQGRKWVALGQFVDKDGVVLCEGQGTWVLAKKRENL
ncbi:hypothetical protein DV736_g4528, partial [Chaetothyriales sp. CBS 134916]